jgi:arabinofuranosyltransferase
MSERYRKTHIIYITLCLLIYASMILRNAWLCDDAYISLRTVDNFVNGFGLTWNVAERTGAGIYSSLVGIFDYAHLCHDR